MLGGNNLVLTPDGYQTVKSKPTKVWNGIHWINPHFKPEGKRDALIVYASNGLSLTLGLDTEVPLEDNDYKEAKYLVSGDYLKRFECTQVHTNTVLTNQESKEVPLNYSRGSKQGWLVERINKQGSYALKVEDPTKLILLLHTLGVYPSVVGKYSVRVPAWCLEAENSRVTVPKLGDIKTDVIVSNVKNTHDSLFSFSGFIIANGILVGHDEC